jgi:hypothetical protein
LARALLRDLGCIAGYCHSDDRREVESGRRLRIGLVVARFLVAALLGMTVRGGIRKAGCDYAMAGGFA